MRKNFPERAPACILRHPIIVSIAWMGRCASASAPRPYQAFGKCRIRCLMNSILWTSDWISGRVAVGGRQRRSRPRHGLFGIVCAGLEIHIPQRQRGAGVFYCTGTNRLGVKKYQKDYQHSRSGVTIASYCVPKGNSVFNTACLKTGGKEKLPVRGGLNASVVASFSRLVRVHLVNSGWCDPNFLHTDRLTGCFLVVL